MRFSADFFAEIIYDYEVILDFAGCVAENAVEDFD